METLDSLHARERWIGVWRRQVWGFVRSTGLHARQSPIIIQQPLLELRDEAVEFELGHPGLQTGQLEGISTSLPLYLSTSLPLYLSTSASPVTSSWRMCVRALHLHTSLLHLSTSLPPYLSACRCVRVTCAWVCSKLIRFHCVSSAVTSTYLIKTLILPHLNSNK